MDIRRTPGRRFDAGSRIWRAQFDALVARILDLVSPTMPGPEFEQPPSGWERDLREENLRLCGYTFLGDAGPPCTLPCEDNVELGECPHVGLFVPICETAKLAQISAAQELKRKDHRARLLGERRWISSISVDARHVYDLSTAVTSAQAEYLRDKLFHTDGKNQPVEPVWLLAKRPGCRGIYLPTHPPTLFIYERFYDDTVAILPHDPKPIYGPPKSPRNALDFVRASR